MLASISESLEGAGLLIENVHTELKRGKGERIDFVVEANCVATRHMDMDEIQEMVTDLTLLKQSLDLEVCDIRVQRSTRIPDQ